MGLAPFIFGMTAATLFIVSSLPQALKIWRAGNADGVNALSWILLYGLVCAWLGYGLRTDNPTLLAANVGGITSCGIVLLAIARARRVRLWAVLPAMTIGGAALTVSALSVPLVVLAVVFALANVIPWLQTFTSMKTLRSGGSSNVSVTTFVMRGMTQMAWLVQCVFTHDLILMMTSSLTLSAAVTTIALELRIASRGPKAAPA